MLNTVSIGYAEGKNLDFSPLEKRQHIEQLSVEQALTVKQQKVLSKFKVLSNTHGLGIK